MAAPACAQKRGNTCHQNIRYMPGGLSSGYRLLCRLHGTNPEPRRCRLDATEHASAHPCRDSGPARRRCNLPGHGPWPSVARGCGESHPAGGPRDFGAAPCRARDLASSRGVLRQARIHPTARGSADLCPRSRQTCTVDIVRIALPSLVDSPDLQFC